ncbi:hypothetical protein P7K49_003123 [Saguinus oedipus]|uniref:Uncharacterized protein n=1 Tax=Saguinus oedipus TaxID=9490 RepID=A0ABQ9WJA7_SAGOE|nr:hypothetical protein P7K49_003123 [Saguinus oedipus]
MAESPQTPGSGPVGLEWRGSHGVLRVERAALFLLLQVLTPLDENDLEEDVDSEPAEIEGEAAEDGDPGDTGAELDDDQPWADSPSEADRELHLQCPANTEEPELRAPDDVEKPISPKQHKRGEPVGNGRNSFQHSYKSHVCTRVTQRPATPEQSRGAHCPQGAGSSLPFLLRLASLCHRLLQMLWPTALSLCGLSLGEGKRCVPKLCLQGLQVEEAHTLTWC